MPCSKHALLTPNQPSVILNSSNSSLVKGLLHIYFTSQQNQLVSLFKFPCKATPTDG